MQFPTLPQQPPQLKNAPSVLKELREQKRLLDIYLETLNKTPSRYPAAGYELSHHIQYHFFHNDEDSFEDILSTQHIPEFDPVFNQCRPEYGAREFSSNAHFLRGCVRISFNPNASEHLSTLAL